MVFSLYFVDQYIKSGILKTLKTEGLGKKSLPFYSCFLCRGAV